MQVPTGGIAHEPQGMIRCDSEADSIVWMKEDKMRKGAVSALAYWMTALECVRSGVFLLRKGFCAPLSRPEPGVRGVSFANVCRNCFDDLQGISGKTPQNNRIKIFRAGCKSLPVV